MAGMASEYVRASAPPYPMPPANCPYVQGGSRHATSGRRRATTAQANASMNQSSRSMHVESQMNKLTRVLDKHEITICEANDLIPLQDYKIVFIADDSGSMSLTSVPNHLRRLGVREPSRWDELCTTLQLTMEIATCFDPKGIDVHFLNRGPTLGVLSERDPQFLDALSRPPDGSTPLCERLEEVVMKCDGERPVLLVIATDGEPNGGPQRFVNLVQRVVQRSITRASFKVQILACTEDKDSIGWLNRLDKAFAEVDVTDDYYSEKKQVLKTRRYTAFTRGDWVMKALLGSVSAKFDQMDEIGLFGRKKKGFTHQKKKCAIM